MPPKKKIKKKFTTAELKNATNKEGIKLSDIKPKEQKIFNERTKQEVSLGSQGIKDTKKLLQEEKESAIITPKAQAEIIQKQTEEERLGDVVERIGSTQLSQQEVDERGILGRTFAPTAEEGAIRGEKILGTSDPRAAIGAGVGAGIIGGAVAISAIPAVTALALSKAATVTTVATGAAKAKALLSTVGVGAGAFGIGKIKKTEVSKANEIFTQSTSNINQIISDAEKGAYTKDPNQALALLEKELDTITQTEKALKIMNRGITGKLLADAEDELVSIADYRRFGLESDKFRLQQALLQQTQPLTLEEETNNEETN